MGLSLTYTLRHPSWVKSEGSREIGKLNYIQPSFAQFHARDKLLVKAKSSAQLVLRHSPSTTLRSKLFD